VWHLGAERSEALVVTASGARLADLGATAPLVALCERLLGARDVADADLAEARARIVAPLGLGADIRAVLVDPEGPVAALPFALLDPAREAAVVPSALLWTLLDAQRDVRGAGVLAVGDADYTGTKWTRLPGTRAEAEAVGTRVLLGRDAAEAVLRRTVAESTRWRALHLACHGTIDRRRASLSGLVLTRAAPDDGVLTAREILAMTVPSDLVLLSACEAGRPGEQGRGFVSAAAGIPPALVAAGCPRVVANLWKVDDEAARIFSVAFHAAWAKEGATAAGAMRAGRDAVRADARFAAPRHWAGWVLWGLPD
jgi:CHAT domain-containing protein